MTTARKSARELRETLRDKFHEAIAAGKPRTARRLLESWWLWDGFGGSDMLDPLRPRSNTDTDDWAVVPPSVPSDRRHGADWWLWRTQQQLDIYRQESRLRYSINAYAQGLLRNLTNNVIGKGYSYEAQVKGPDGKPLPEKEISDRQQAECDAVQRVIEKFCRLNNWNGVVNPVSNDAVAATWERQLFRLQKIDGDVFPRFHGQDDGSCLVRLIDSAQVREGGAYLPSEGWSYGIQHAMQPFEDVMRYHRFAVFWADPAAKGGTDGVDRGVWEEVDAEQVIHVKGPDTPINVKRGLGLFLFDLGKSLDRAAKLQRNLSIGASVRAGVAWTEQWAQATQAQLTSFAAAVAERTHVGPNGRTRYSERMDPGTVRRVPEGWSMGESPTDSTPSFMEGVQGDLQMAGAGVCAPAFWFGNVGDANYNNAESAAAPAVRDGLAEQEYWKAVFARCLWKAVLWAQKCGLLREGIEERILIDVTAPAVLHRNELEKAQEDQILIQSGIKDRQTAAAERGLDWGTVQANNQDYQAEMGGEMSALPMPGEGQEGGGADQPPLPQPKDGAQGVREGLLEAWLREEGFTGIDAHGHKWVNGQQVKRDDEGGGQAAGGAADSAAPGTAGKKAPAKAKSALPPPAATRGAKPPPKDSELPADVMAGAREASEAAKKAISAYTSSAYLDVNRSLRSGQPVPERHQETAKQLHEWIDKQPPFAQPVTAYRGLSADADKIKALVSKMEAAAKSGEPIELNGFTSTSLDPKTALAFTGTQSADVLFELSVHKGGYLDGLSGMPTERELLLDHGSRFRVAGVREVKFKSGGGTVKRRVIQLEQVA